MKKVLSLSGGGIRGLITTIFLQEIEDRMDEPIADLFDLIIGTSTGGILTYALTVPNDHGNPRFTAEELSKIYEVWGRRIFSRSALRKFTTLDAMIDAKYDIEKLRRVLQRFFRGTTIDKSLTKTVTTSYEIEDEFPFLIKSYKGSHHQITMTEGALATASAPTYFEPVKIDVGHREYILVDGGLFASNPSLFGFLEAQKLFPDEEILVVSLGTGIVHRSFDYSKAKDTGLIRWLPPLIDLMFKGQERTSEVAVSQLADEFFSFNIRLRSDASQMDDADSDSLTIMRWLAEEALQEQGDKFFELESYLDLE